MLFQNRTVPKLVLWDKFQEIFDAISSGERKILIRSANGVGKTTALAALCNWKLHTTKSECIVLTTSSSEKQLRHNLWGEIRRQAALAGLYSKREVTATHIKVGEKRFMVAVSPAKPESAQGYHAGSMFIAVDEATGVRRDIIEALIATATGDDVTIVMIYNPMSTDSFVYEAERSGVWKVITIGAFDHPNITKGRTLIPGAVTIRNTEERLAMWSFEVDPESDRSFLWRGKWWYKTSEVCRRILGSWYDGDGDGLIPQFLVKRSLEVAPVGDRKLMGVDLAGGGEDETVIARFIGSRQLPFISVRTKDPMRIADLIEREYRDGFMTIAIDETGIFAGLTPILRERGIEAASVNFGSKPLGLYNTDYRKLANSRAEMYYHLLEELKHGRIRLIDDERLHAEITTVQKGKTERDLYYLELKDLVRKRLGRSPDRADATVLALYAALIDKYKKRFKIEIDGVWVGGGR